MIAIPSVSAHRYCLCNSAIIRAQHVTVWTREMLVKRVESESNGMFARRRGDVLSDRSDSPAKVIAPHDRRSTGYHKTEAVEMTCGDVETCSKLMRGPGSCTTARTGRRIGPSAGICERAE